MSLPATAPVHPRDIDWRWALPRIAVVFIVTRLLVLVLAVAVETTEPMPTGDFRPDDRPVVGALTSWDAVYYLRIADDGYHEEVVDFPDYAFFPAFPITVRAASLLTGGDLGVAALLASNVAFALALIVLYALSVRYFTPERSLLSLWFLALAPGAIGFGFAYTESLFLLLATGAFLAAELRRPWLVGLALAVAAVSRVPGVLLVLPVFMLYLQRDGWRPTRHWLPLLLAPMALLLHFGALWLVTGDPLAPISAQEYWNAGAEGGTTLAESAGEGQLTLLGALAHPAIISSILLLPFYLFLFVFFRHDRIKPAYWLVCITALAAVFLGGDPFSNARYLAVAWPFSWVLANRQSRWGRGIVLVAFTVGQVTLLWLALVGDTAP